MFFFSLVIMLRTSAGSECYSQSVRDKSQKNVKPAQSPMRWCCTIRFLVRDLVPISLKSILNSLRFSE
jgi:hypothetical protein